MITLLLHFQNFYQKYIFSFLKEVQNQSDRQIRFETERIRIRSCRDPYSNKFQLIVDNGYWILIRGFRPIRIRTISTDSDSEPKFEIHILTLTSEFNRIRMRGYENFYRDIFSLPMYLICSRPIRPCCIY